MNSAFEKLPEEKKKAILDVCIEEFGTKGYENTSTDVITARAGISKGILFHYFRNKKNLYLYLVQYVIDTLGKVTTEEFNKIDTDDFFEKMKQLALAKQRLALIYKNETNFIRGLMFNPPLAAKKEVDEIMARIYASSMKLQNDMIKNMVIPKLKNDVSMETAVEATNALFNHLTNKYTSILSTYAGDLDNAFDEMIKDMDNFCNIIKYGIYKQ